MPQANIDPPPVFMLSDSKGHIGAYSTLEAAEAYMRHCTTHYTDEHDLILARLHGAPVLYPFYIHEYTLNEPPYSGYTIHPTRQLATIRVYLKETDHATS